MSALQDFLCIWLCTTNCTSLCEYCYHSLTHYAIIMEVSLKSSIQCHCESLNEKHLKNLLINQQALFVLNACLVNSCVLLNNVL